MAYVREKEQVGGDEAGKVSWAQGLEMLHLFDCGRYDKLTPIIHSNLLMCLHMLQKLESQKFHCLPCR